MKKTTLALVLGTGMILGVVAPSARAATMLDSKSKAIQTLASTDMSVGQFNSLFTPYNTAILSPYRFDGSDSDAGLIQSQVFKGTGAADGLFAYAYQVAVNGGAGPDVHLDSTSFKFSDTPMGTDLTNAGALSYAYIVRNGQVGGLNLSGAVAPVTLSWQPGANSGVIRAQYVDPATQTDALNPGANSATFVLISDQMPSDVKPSVNVGGPAATTTVPVAYSTTQGSIEPIPVPEPSTVLAWSGMVAAAALVRRFRVARAKQGVAA